MRIIQGTGASALTLSTRWHMPWILGNVNFVLRLYLTSRCICVGNYVSWQKPIFWWLVARNDYIHNVDCQHNLAKTSICCFSFLVKDPKIASFSTCLQYRLLIWYMLWASLSISTFFILNLFCLSIFWYHPILKPFLSSFWIAIRTDL